MSQYIDQLKGRWKKKIQLFFDYPSRKYTTDSATLWANQTILKYIKIFFGGKT
ncbi:hypothetical protein MCERE19_00092 [Spirosomataceae bacterium]